MAAFFVNVSTSEPTKKHISLPHQQYSLEERKLMADILYEDLSSKRSTVTFDKEERRIMAEIARQKDLEEKAKHSKEFSEKLQQMQTKREELEAEKKARAQEKLKRVLNVTKPDLLSDTVKKYDTKRSEVLERIHKKEEEKRAKLEKAMNREKAIHVSEVAKKYDEKRAEVLERITKKAEEKKIKYEEKMNKALPDKSSQLPDIAKNYDNRRAEVLDRIKRAEEEKKLKLEKKIERVENANHRHKSKIEHIREQSLVREQSITKGANLFDATNNKSEKEDEDRDAEKQGNKDVPSSDYSSWQQGKSKTKKDLRSCYNSFVSKSALPPIGCN